MGGCSASKLDQEEDDVVFLCRERKRLLKSAVDRRYLLADSHCKYLHSLHTVAAAIRLFVARHTSPSSPFLITFPPPPSSPTSKQNPQIDSAPEPLPGITHQSSSSSSMCSCSEDEEEVGEEVEMERDHQMGCGYSCSGIGAPVHSPQRDFGWDFFNPFEGVRVEPVEMMMGGLSRGSDEDLRVVREEEGIPELEEEEEEEEEEKGKVVAEVSVDGVEMVKLGSETGRREQVEQPQNKGLTVIDTPARERELMDALKDVEDHFIRAYDSGKEVSRMLEANRVHLQSGLEEIKGGFLSFE